jgi:hypothetical protein
MVSFVSGDGPRRTSSTAATTTLLWLVLGRFTTYSLLFLAATQGTAPTRIEASHRSRRKACPRGVAGRRCSSPPPRHVRCRVGRAPPGYCPAWPRRPPQRPAMRTNLPKLAHSERDRQGCRALLTAPGAKHAAPRRRACPCWPGALHGDSRGGLAGPLRWVLTLTAKVAKCYSSSEAPQRHSEDGIRQLGIQKRDRSVGHPRGARLEEHYRSIPLRVDFMIAKYWYRLTRIASEALPKVLDVHGLPPSRRARSDTTLQPGPAAVSSRRASSSLASCATTDHCPATAAACSAPASAVSTASTSCTDGCAKASPSCFSKLPAASSPWFFGSGVSSCALSESLGSSAARRGGSTPLSRTKMNLLG